MGSKSIGNCYLCGEELARTAMKNHLLKVHGEQDGEQECCLLKIEGAEYKDYWLYIDIPVDKSLSAVDTFLRKIWLECCGHLSAFRGPGRSEIAMSRKMRSFAVGDSLLHEYDFGTTTDTTVTFVGISKRKTQRGIVRLLARNIPPEFECGECGAPATFICPECRYTMENHFFCDECAEGHELDQGHMMLPVTNSPRSGECGYAGELDIFDFDPDRVKG